MRLLFARFIGGSIAFIKVFFMLVITWLFLPAIFVYIACQKKESLTETAVHENMKDVYKERLH